MYYKKDSILGLVIFLKKTYFQKSDHLAQCALVERIGLSIYTKLLFTSLVLPNLKYCSVWSLQYQVHVDRIESVQKQFLLFDLRGLTWIKT